MRGLDPEVVQAVLSDWKSAPIDGRLRAALAFLERVTLEPTQLSDPSLIKAMLNQGILEEGVRELLYVCFLFNVLDRLADAWDFDLPTGKSARRIGFLAHRLGYGIARLPG